MDAHEKNRRRMVELLEQLATLDGTARIASGRREGSALRALAGTHSGDV